jgi:hypothetical protein
MKAVELREKIREEKVISGPAAPPAAFWDAS